MPGAPPPLVRAIHAFDAAMGSVDFVVRVVIGAAMLGIFAMLITQVLIRYVVDYRLPWLEEVAIYLSGYVALWGTAVCLRASFHLEVDLLVDKLPERGAHVLRLLLSLIVAAYAVVLIRRGYAFVELGWGQSSPSSYLYVHWARFAMPTGGVLIFLQALTLAGRRLITFKGWPPREETTPYG